MILLPIGHERQTVQRLPWVTFILIGICVAAYLYTGVIVGGDDSALSAKVDAFFKYYTQHPYLDMPPEMGQFLTREDHETIAMLQESVDRATLDTDAVREEQNQINELALDALEALNANPLRKWGYIPNDPHVVNIFTCLFLHEGFWHLFGNMLFLFLAGCALEDLWGRPLYLGFYLMCGIAATVTHDLKFPSSAVPIIGASGAIAGLMGAFLVRLAKTRIKFFYFFWFFTIKMGTFEAPAFVVLPMWFAQQIAYAMLTQESAGVAFWAHIGGFVFGTLFAFGMNAMMIEERFIAPSIEKKVSLVQNPLFLSAISLSERGEYPQALVQLQRVVRMEPNHMDAYMEMRTIYEKLEDAAGYAAVTGGILDIALRSKDSEVVLTNLEQYKRYSLKKPLPAKTLLGLGAFFEEGQDDHGAAFQYEELTRNYPDDPLAMKAYSKLARLCIERLNDRERGEAAFWSAYDHPLANNEWRAALQAEMKRYQINPKRDAPRPAVAQRLAPAAAAVSFVPASADIDFGDAPGIVAPLDEHAPPPSPAAAPAAPTPAQGGMLPWSDFDGAYSEWTVVACRFGKIGLKGLNLFNTREGTALLPWKKIRVVSAARIKSLGTGAPGARDSLLLDLIVPISGSFVIYRTTGKAIDFRVIFPLVEQTFFDAYENFLGILLTNSGARCFPDRERCIGPVFAEFADLGAYERKLREDIAKQGQPA